MIVLGTIILLLSYLTQANDTVAGMIPNSWVDINGVQFIAFFNLIIGGLIAHVYGIKNAARNADEGKNGSAIACFSLALGVIAIIFAGSSLITNMTGSLPWIQKDAELAIKKYEKQCELKEMENESETEERQYRNIYMEYQLHSEEEAYKDAYAALCKSLIDPVKNDTSLTEAEKEKAIQAMRLAKAEELTYDEFSKKYFKQYIAYLEETNSKELVNAKDIEDTSVIGNIMAQIKNAFFSINGAVYIPSILIIIAMVTTFITLRTKKKQLGYINLGILMIGLVLAFATCVLAYPNA